MITSKIVYDVLEVSPGAFEPGDSYMISCCRTGNVLIRNVLKDSSIDINGLNPGMYMITLVSGADIKQTNFEKQ